VEKGENDLEKDLRFAEIDYDDCESQIRELSGRLDECGVDQYHLAIEARDEAAATIERLQSEIAAKKALLVVGREEKEEEEKEETATMKKWPSVVHTQSGAVYACEGRFGMVEIGGWYYVQELNECGRVVGRTNGMSLLLASDELVGRVVLACMPPLQKS